MGVPICQDELSMVFCLLLSFYPATPRPKDSISTLLLWPNVDRLHLRRRVNAGKMIRQRQENDSSPASHNSRESISNVRRQYQIKSTGQKDFGSGYRQGANPNPGSWLGGGPLSSTR